MKKQKDTSISTVFQKSMCEKLFAPIITAGVFLIFISYSVDIIYLNTIPDNLGESTAVSAVLLKLGDFISKYAYITIPLSIAYQKHKTEVIPCTLVASAVALNGLTFENAEGQIAAIPGIWGFLLTGYAVIYIFSLCQKTQQKLHIESSLFLQISAILLSTISVLIINGLSGIIYSFATTLLLNLASVETILFPIILGIFTVIDGSGPLFLSAYIFSTTSITAGKPQVMAAVTAAGMVPSLACALFAFIYKERLSKTENRAAFISVAPTLLGLSQISHIFYITKTFRFILPCVAGSIMTSLLSILLGCSYASASGGLVNLANCNNPMYLMLCIIFGVLTATALMSVTITKQAEEKKYDNNSQESNSIPFSQNAAKS